MERVELRFPPVFHDSENGLSRRHQFEPELGVSSKA